LDLLRSGPFPELGLRGLDRSGSLREALRGGGEALVVFGHSACGTTRLVIPFAERIRVAGATVALVLQDQEADARSLLRDLAVGAPVWLEEAPYPLAAALGVQAVPTLFLLDPAGQILSLLEGFNRLRLEEMASRLGVTGGLFRAEDAVPSHRPG
jgi:hypothetical protein